MPQAAASYAAGCNPTYRRLQPYVPQAATLCAAGSMQCLQASWTSSLPAAAPSMPSPPLRAAREALQRMQAQASPLAAALEHAVLKYLCFQATTYSLL